jgi:hypothetical protein
MVREAFTGAGALNWRPEADAPSAPLRYCQPKSGSAKILLPFAQSSPA